MSLWKWNNFEKEIDIEDVDFHVKCEAAFEQMSVTEDNLLKTGTNSSILRAYCGMYFSLFDAIFGPGTHKKLFGDHTNVRMVEECYDSFLTFYKNEIAESNKRRIA